jgi:hypothetical protein
LEASQTFEEMQIMNKQNVCFLRMVDAPERLLVNWLWGRRMVDNLAMVEWRPNRKVNFAVWEQGER